VKMSALKLDVEQEVLCGRKHKFGLNLQGTCDSECRFLDLYIQHPTSTLDFLAFTTSSLYRKLEQPNFLAPGLCLFGDSAYTNCRYFSTPYKSISAGTKDDYNFFHSQASDTVNCLYECYYNTSTLISFQLHIKIECAFGQLVCQWGILQHALLHNYCINEWLAVDSEEVPTALAADHLEIIANGGVAFGRNSRQQCITRGTSTWRSPP
jgi:DDE superfamily endonuclease